MLTCQDVANYFLFLADAESDSISNLKLQKLVYYAQGFHLALFGKPLFEEPIKAWTHGPVVPELYHTYKDYGSGGLPSPEEIDLDIYTPDERELLEEVHSVYGQFSAWKLRNMTHEEEPWKSCDTNETITHKSLKRFFKTQLVDEDD